VEDGVQVRKVGGVRVGKFSPSFIGYSLFVSFSFTRTERVQPNTESHRTTLHSTELYIS
jgi:hypothetical protein